jgi:hypothetical protein
MPRGDNFRGGKPVGSGRPKGGKNIKSILIEDILNQEKYVEMINNGTFLSPVSFWIEVLHDENNPYEMRNEAAKNLAKYLHKAQPQMTEQNITTSDENGFTISLISSKRNDDPKY